jgi:cell division septation protein DedD
LKDPLTNPHGIEKCTVGVYHRPTRSDPFERIVHTVYWEEFAPLVERGDSDAYEWVDTGEKWPDSGKPKMRKQLREGATKTLRLDAHTRGLKPEEVASFVIRNREGLREFWGRSKNDALELKKILEQRSATVTPSRDDVREKAAPSESTEAGSGPDNGAAASKPAPSVLTGEEAEKLRAALLIDLAQLRTRKDFDTWARDAKAHIARLPDQMRSEVESELDHRRRGAR